MLKLIPFSIFAVVLVAVGAPRLFAAAATQPEGPGGAAAPALRPWQLDDDDDDDTKPATAPTTASAPPAPGGRYFFGLLNNRSSYGKDFFPDPFIGPEFDADRQLEVDYAHSEGHGSREDEIDAEMDWTLVGKLSVSAEIGWNSQHAAGQGMGDDGEGERAGGTGFENVDLAVYHPVFQYVSQDRFLDYTAVLRLEVGIPTRTAVSGGDAQLTPYLGHLLRLGDHLSAEAWTGWQFTIAPHQATDLIYGVSLGYQLRREQLPWSLTQDLTPMFEIDGRSPMSGPGPDALLGVAGFSAKLAILGQEPKFQFGYEFPIDQGGRDQLRWGILAQVYFDF